MPRRNRRLAAANTLALGAAIAPIIERQVAGHAQREALAAVRAELAKPRFPYCIPVDWSAGGAHWRAYHHGWSDARLYSVIKLGVDKPHVHAGDYVATVDDFGDLVPIADISEWGFLHPRFPVWIERNAEMH